LRDISDTNIRVLAYSRSFVHYAKPISYLPPDIRSRYAKSNRIFLIPISSDMQFWRDEKHQKIFQEAITQALVAN
jgi:hypothetical protein